MNDFSTSAVCEQLPFDTYLKTLQPEDLKERVRVVNKEDFETKGQEKNDE